jgi:hypothetical protein
VGMSVAVGCSVAVSFKPAMAVAWARVSDVGTSIVGPAAGGLDAQADNKINKIIASVMFVFMMSPICILYSPGCHGDMEAFSFINVSISVRVYTSSLR